ncbi:unnamed protein product [Chrysoparadoxa australica]
MTTTAEVFIRVDPRLRVFEATDIARRAQQKLKKRINDLCSAKVISKLDFSPLVCAFFLCCSSFTCSVTSFHALIQSVSRLTCT